MIKRWIEFIVSHPKRIVAAVALISVFFFYQMSHLRFEIDLKRTFPQDHPFVILNNRIQDTFDSGKLVLIGILPRVGDIFQPETIRKIDSLTRKVSAIPGVNNVISITDPKTSYLAADENSIDVQPLIADIPENDDLHGFELLKKRVYESTPYIGSLVSADGTAASILVDFREETSDPFIHEAISNILSDEADEFHRTLLAGIPIGLTYLDRYSKTVVFIFPIALLIITGMHYWTFRSWQSVFLPFATGLMSVGWSLGLMGMLNIPMDTFNTGTPVLVLAVAGGHSVQILKRYYEELYRLRDNKAATIEATSGIGVVMITAGMIAALSLASLSFTFRLQTIRSFGMLCSFGIVSALILEMTFIPACRSLLRISKSDIQSIERRDILDSVIQALQRIHIMKRTRMMIVLPFALVTVFLGINRVLVTDNWKKYYPSTTPLLQDDRLMNDKFYGTSTFYVLIEAETPGDIQEPAVLAGMRQIEDFLKRQPGIGGVVSLTDYLSWMNRVMHNGNPAYDRVPESRQLAAQYLLTYSMSREQGILDRFVDYGSQRALIRGFLKSDDITVADALVRRLNHHIEGLFPSNVAVRIAGGSAGNMLAVNKILVEGKLLNILQMGAVVFLISSLVFRSFAGGLVISVPLYATILMNFSVMGWTGITLSVATSHISAMIMGFGADYAIYYIYRYREEWIKHRDPERALNETLDTSGKAILFMASAIAAGYLPFAFSVFSPFRDFGILVISAMLNCAFATLYILPYIVDRFKPQFIFNTQTVSPLPDNLNKLIKEKRRKRCDADTKGPDTCR